MARLEIFRFPVATSLERFDEVLLLNAPILLLTGRPQPRARRGPLALLSLLLFAVAIQAQTQVPTRFNYDGVLTDDGAAIDTGGVAALYDLEFRVYDHPDEEQARQVGPMVSLESHPLTDGRVQAELDFGAEIFQLPRRYLEIRYRRSDGSGEPGVFRSQLQITASQPPEETLPPPESDAEVLQRLEIARIVISDRQNPGNPHFLVDERSFRRAYGVASPVTPTDVASVAMVAASELRRQTVRSQERIEVLEAEISVLRFRSNLAFLMLAAMIVSVLLSRRRSSTAAPVARSPDRSATAETRLGAPADTETTATAAPDGPPPKEEPST